MREHMARIWVRYFVCAVFKGKAAASNLSLRDFLDEGGNCILRFTTSRDCAFSFRMKECKPKPRS